MMTLAGGRKGGSAQPEPTGPTSPIVHADYEVRAFTDSSTAFLVCLYFGG